jgi:hypothetical protein
LPVLGAAALMILSRSGKPPKLVIGKALLPFIVVVYS